MKKLICLALCLAPLVSCVSRGSAEKIRDEKDSLSMVVATKDSLLNEVLSAINNISENLSAIKVREGLLSAADNNEIGKMPTAQISEDIAAIDELLQANKTELAQLRKSAAQLRKANNKIEGLEKLIADLDRRMAEKDAEITELKDNLTRMGMEVEELNDVLKEQTSTINDLTYDNVNLKEEVKSNNTLLHTAYYIIGSQKELLNSKILYKTGFVGRTLKLNENRSLDNFTQTDTRTLDELLIGHKGVTIVTTHPSDSYQLAESEDKTVEKLIITDPERFWEYSKVLVVSYK